MDLLSRIVLCLLWFGTLACAGFGFWMLQMAFDAGSAPTQAAGAAIACACAVVPYVITRAVESLLSPPPKDRG